MEGDVAEALLGGGAGGLVLLGHDAVILDTAATDDADVAGLDETPEGAREAEHAGDALEEDAVQQGIGVVFAERADEAEAVDRLTFLVVDVAREGGGDVAVLDIGGVEAVRLEQAVGDHLAVAHDLDVGQAL